MLVAAVVSAVLVFSALATAANAGDLRSATGGVTCPLTAAELSTIAGKTLQRVNLGDADGDPAAQCSFSAVSRLASSHFVSPQVFLTVSPGGASDLRDLYLYYRRNHARLGNGLQVTSRPDLGQGAFTLTASATPVATAYFLLGKGGVGTLLVDLTDAGAGRRGQATTDKVFALVVDRLQ